MEQPWDEVQLQNRHQNRFKSRRTTRTEYSGLDQRSEEETVSKPVKNRKTQLNYITWKYETAAFKWAASLLQMTSCSHYDGATKFFLSTFFKFQRYGHLKMRFYFLVPEIRYQNGVMWHTYYYTSNYLLKIYIIHITLRIWNPKFWSKS